jgi:hypothetical protein
LSRHANCSYRQDLRRRIHVLWPHCPGLFICVFCSSNYRGLWIQWYVWISLQHNQLS